MRWPEGPARIMAVSAIAVWAGALTGRGAFVVCVLVANVALLAAVAGQVKGSPPVTVVALALLAGLIAGGWSAHREREVLTAQVPDGPVSILARLTMDPVAGSYGDTWFLVRPLAIGDLPWRGPPMLVSATEATGAMAGEIVAVRGDLRAPSGWARGTPYAARLRASSVETVPDSAPIPVAVGNDARQRVLDRLDQSRPGAALLSGFLVGAVEQLPASDHEALRRAGLSHFVAVSGSNVAWFLLLWWMLLGPIGLGAARGWWGLVGLLLFVIVTRWEPSVVRASLMAGSVLAGRVMGWPLDSWTALAASIILALLVSSELAVDVGFQLSVLATAGILTGGDVLPAAVPRWLRTPLGATLAAQVAVLPLLLVVFGTVPLLSPITNLVAGPLVTLATMVGGLGTVTGVAPLTELGIVLAEVVLTIARLSSSWPQIGPPVALLVVGLAWCLRSPRLRPLAVFLGAVLVAVPLLVAPSPPRLAVVFLDVGQGDAALLIGASGAAILVDGGPDPFELAMTLNDYQVRGLHLVVVTHAHEDHAGGVAELPGRIPVGAIWYPGPPHTSPAWEEVVASARSAGVSIVVPEIGSTHLVDGMRLTVLGPLRRYEGINDQSIVLQVDAGGTRVLLTGDIEVTAQIELGAVPTDVLKVPHHGALTSDLDWLRKTNPRLSIISVGENDYGHPAEEVLSALDGSVIARTDTLGDIVVPLSGDPLSRLPAAMTGRSP